ncbi:hypothetical protein NKI96_10690 [Mesorhizobium sp. M0292]|uniref:hypothetical protein n=1 Tax=Mesorhizobium sp. M0292 TaxID=2956929 RepID=UPI003339B6F9
MTLPDYSTYSDDALAVAAGLVKLDLNAGYGRIPAQELTRIEPLFERIAAIRAEQKRRPK